MPSFFPNPTFGTGLPQNVVPGFTQAIVEMQLAASGQTAPTVTLFQQAGNSGLVCKLLDIHSNGGVIPNVTIAPLGSQVLSVAQAPAAFLGAVPAFTNPGFVVGLAPMPGTPPFVAGPVTVGPGMQTFQICANTDPLGNVSGSFNYTVTINGAGVGSITIPINFLVGSGAPPQPGSGINLSQLAVFRGPSTPATPMTNQVAGAPAPGTALAVWAFDSNGNNTFDASDKYPRFFGLNGDMAVAGDWDGTGIVRIGVFRCPSPAVGVCQWYIDLNNNGQWDGPFGGDAIWNFGLTGDIPASSVMTMEGRHSEGRRAVRCPYKHRDGQQGNPLAQFAV
jgi:hypothetical protein